MYAVREEVEVLKEQIKELLEKNSQLETENSLLKTLASPEQMAQFHAQVQSDCSPTGGGEESGAGLEAELEQGVGSQPGARRRCCRRHRRPCRTQARRHSNRHVVASFRSEEEG